MQRVLIAGAGDLGTRVAELLAPHCELTLIRRSPLVKITGAHVRTVQADLQQFSAIADVIEAPDSILFSASPEARAPQSYAAIYGNALAQIVRWRRHARIFLCSSTAVYRSQLWRQGDALDMRPALQTEASNPEPDGFNGAALLAGEALLDASDCRLRLAGIYGPERQLLLRRARSAEPLVRSPQSFSNRIHIDDAAAVIARLMQQAQVPPVVNLVDHNPTPSAEVLDAICRKHGYAKLPEQQASAEHSLGKRIGSAYHAQPWYALQYPSYQKGYGLL
jgi:nucleoside-diphosphate-sugar epimerase